MLLENQTWPAVESYLQTKKMIIVPIGSTEQHGPTGLIGTDFLTAQSISERVGEIAGVMVAPTLKYGMATHHMCFAGSATLQPSTFILVIRDVVESFVAHGFDKIIFINGHGGNMAPLTTAFSEIKKPGVDVLLKTINWWHASAVTEYEAEHFGEANGHHATCGEVAVTMQLRPEAFESIEPVNFEIDRPDYSMPLSATEFRQTFPDGRMMSNPGLSTQEHGKALFERACDCIAKKVSKILES